MKKLVRQNLMRKRTPKTVKFAVNTNDEMIQNKLKDSRIAKIKSESKDVKLRWMHTVA